MNNSGLLLIAGLAAIYLLTSNRGGGSAPAGTVLINGQAIPVQQLPSLGYVYYNGQNGGTPGWYHMSQFPGYSQANANNPQWYNYVQTALSTGSSIWQTLMPIFSSSNNAATTTAAGTPVPVTYSSGIPGTGTQITINGMLPGKEWVEDIWGQPMQSSQIPPIYAWMQQREKPAPLNKVYSIV